VSSVSGSWYYYLLSATHQKCNFPKRNYQCYIQWTDCKAITVTNGVQNVHHQRSHSRSLVRYWQPCCFDKVKSVSMLTSEWAILTSVSTVNNIGNCNFWVPIYHC